MKLVKYFKSFLLSILFVVAITSTSFAYRDMLTPSFINNFKYYNKYYSGFVTLKGGKFVKPYSVHGMHFLEKVGIVKYLITKTNNGDPTAAVVLYYQDTGGNMAFYQMYVFYQKGNRVYQLKPIDLGGGINFQKIIFVPGSVSKFAVIYYSLGPHDPMCCPTKYTTKTINVNTK